jgi:hypothetical protein
LTIGIKGAVEFLQKQCGVVSLKVLPYKSMLIPLVRFFATENENGFHPTAEQLNTLRAWFWSSCFSRRYSNSVDTSLDADIKAAIHLREKKDAKDFNLVLPRIDRSFFLNNVFSLTAVNTKSFVLLLASKAPRSFLSGANIDLNTVLLTCNRTEFHHVFPKNHLETTGVTNRDEQFRLANFAFLSQTDNRKIKNRPPSNYQDDIPGGAKDDILGRAMIPKGALTDSYENFCKARADMLLLEALALCKP